MSRPAVLVDADLTAIAQSPSWTRAYRTTARPFDADPLAGHADAARELLADGLRAASGLFPPTLDVRPVSGSGTATGVDGLLITQTSAAPSADAVASLDTLIEHLGIAVAANPGMVQQVQIDYCLKEAEALREVLLGGAGSGDGVPTGSLNVLVVDDNSANVRLVVRMCDALGLEPDTASDGAEALATMARAPYDLVFMDVMMPGANGAEVTEVIRSRFGDGPCVVGVTAMPDAEGRCIAAGMDAVFLKPLRLDMVSQAVRIATARRTAAVAG